MKSNIVMNKAATLSLVAVILTMVAAGVLLGFRILKVEDTWAMTWVLYLILFPVMFWMQKSSPKWIHVAEGEWELEPISASWSFALALGIGICYAYLDVYRLGWNMLLAEKFCMNTFLVSAGLFTLQRIIVYFVRRKQQSREHIWYKSIVKTLSSLKEPAGLSAKKIMNPN